MRKFFERLVLVEKGQGLLKFYSTPPIRDPEPDPIPHPEPDEGLAKS